MIGLIITQKRKHLSQDKICVLYGTYYQSYQRIRDPMDKETDEERYNGGLVSKLCIQPTTRCLKFNTWSLKHQHI